jgi:hypothetical protein
MHSFRKGYVPLCLRSANFQLISFIFLVLQDLYLHVGWPLYKRFGHAFEGFKQMVANADEILKSLVKEVKETDPETGKEVRSSATLASVACLDWQSFRGDPRGPIVIVGCNLGLLPIRDGWQAFLITPNDPPGTFADVV